jgi:hypothetical protein
MDFKLRIATSPAHLIKSRPNLLESRSPVAEMSPVHSQNVSVSQSDKVPSSVSSTLSSRSEIDSAKHVIIKALNLKKNVSELLPLIYDFRV